MAINMVLRIKSVPVSPYHPDEKGVGSNRVLGTLGLGCKREHGRNKAVG